MRLQTKLESDKKEIVWRIRKLKKTADEYPKNNEVRNFIHMLLNEIMVELMIPKEVVDQLKEAEESGEL